MTGAPTNFTRESAERIGDTVRGFEDLQRAGETRPKIHRGGGFVPGVEARELIIREIPEDDGGIVKVERVVEGPNYSDTLIMTPVSELESPPEGPHVRDMAVARHTLGEDYNYAVWPVGEDLTLETEIVRAFKIGGRWRVEQTVRMMIRKISEEVQHGSCRLGVS